MAPLVIVSHAVLLVAAHPHPVVVVTETLAAPPLLPGVALVGDTVKLQEAAACVIVTVCPATVSVPVRDDVTVFVATEYPTAPLPVPLAPLVTVNQLALLVALQAHPLVVVTETLAAPPLAPGIAIVGDTV